MNSNYQQKLFNYQEVPPSDCWEKISSSFKDDTAFPYKLYNYQAKPTATVWQKIVDTLDQHKSKTYYIPRRNVAAYTVVAALVLVIVFITFFTLQQRTTPTPVSNQPDRQETNNSVSQSNSRVTSESSNALTPVSTSSTLSTPFLRETKKKVSNSAVTVAVKRRSSSTITDRIIKTIKQSSVNNNNPSSNYISFTDGDVKVKVTKKVLPLMNCPDGDASCIERIKALQEKISSASINADFSGFIEILKHVQENY